MGTPIDGVDVFTTTGVIDDTTVRFRSDGWIRVGTREEGYTYYPDHRVKCVKFDPEGSE